MPTASSFNLQKEHQQYANANEFEPSHGLPRDFAATKTASGMQNTIAKLSLSRWENFFNSNHFSRIFHVQKHFKK